MPNKNTSPEDDYDDVTFEGSDQTDPVKTDGQGGDQTPPAENKDFNNGVSTDQQKTSAELQEIEELKKQMKAIASNNAKFGAFSKNASKYLVDAALSGDQEAIDTIKSNSKYNQYIKKNFKDDYDLIFDESENKVSFNQEEIVEMIKKDLKNEEQDKEITNYLQNSGIKGVEDYKKAKGIVKSLIDQGIDMKEAVKGALTIVRPQALSAPYLPNSNYSNNFHRDNGGKIEITRGQQNVLKFFQGMQGSLGIDLSDQEIKRSISENKDFFSSNATHYSFIDGKMVEADDSIKQDHLKGNIF